MKCRNCGKENKAGRKYCKKCGALVKPVCPDCGFDNEEDAIFCGGCGRDLRQKTKPPVHTEKEISSVSEIQETGKPKLDMSRLLQIDEEKKTEKLNKDKKNDKLAEKPKEKQKEEKSDKMKMTQDSIEQLFEEKEKQEGELIQKETKVEAKPEEEQASRFVDKNSPSAFDSPITQSELDRLVEEYEKKHSR